jgi:tetratricopeptide (TPR) repeat protein
MKFDQLVNVEISDKSNALPPSQLSFQLSLGKELIGDAHKKMKKYKQASKSYQEALNEIVKLQKAKVAGMSNRLQHSHNKLQTKIAMCAYYLGQVTKAISLFGNQIKYYSKFDPANLKVQ